MTNVPRTSTMLVRSKTAEDIAISLPSFSILLSSLVATEP